MVELTEVGTVTSKSMITIPARIMRKYGIKQGDKISFEEQQEGILLRPRRRLMDYYGIDAEHHDKIIQAIKELDAEHRQEARRDKELRV